MDTKDAYIRQLENQISAMQKQIDNLTELILIMRQDKFGASSEKTPKDAVDGQLSLFDEAEVCADASVPEPVTKEAGGYIRKDSRTKRAERIKDLPVRIIPCSIPGEDKICIQCGCALKFLGTETVREELEYIPAKLQIVRYTREACECPKCKRTARPFIMKAQIPTSLMNHSLASPSSVANVMYQKYVNSVPLYRQEKDWENLGLSLKRATMAHWIIRCAQDYFTPVIEHLKKEPLAVRCFTVMKRRSRCLRRKGKSRSQNLICGCTAQAVMINVPSCFMITSHPEAVTKPWNFSKDSMDISIPTATPVTTNWEISRGVAAGRTSDGSLWKLFREGRRLARRLLPQKQAGITATSSSGLRSS